MCSLVFNFILTTYVAAYRSVERKSFLAFTSALKGIRFEPVNALALTLCIRLLHESTLRRANVSVEWNDIWHFAGAEIVSVMLFEAVYTLTYVTVIRFLVRQTFSKALFVVQWDQVVLRAGADTRLIGKFCAVYTHAYAIRWFAEVLLTQPFWNAGATVQISHEARITLAAQVLEIYDSVAWAHPSNNLSARNCVTHLLGYALICRWKYALACI